jgi:hypothetical protein
MIRSPVCKKIHIGQAVERQPALTAQSSRLKKSQRDFFNILKRTMPVSQTLALSVSTYPTGHHQRSHLATLSSRAQTPPGTPALLPPKCTAQKTLSAPDLTIFHASHRRASPAKKCKTPADNPGSANGIC